MITKKYKLNIYKKLGEHSNIITDIPVSDEFVKTKKEYTLSTFNTDMLSEVFTVTKENNKLTIYSNTLGILLGLNEYYYWYDISNLIEQYPEDYLNLIKQHFNDFKIDNNKLYLKDKNEEYINLNGIVLYIKPVLDLSLNKFYNYPNVTIKKLKNKFKIVITNSLDYDIKLLHKYLLEPVQFHNSIRFIESVLLKEHSFNIFNKSEIVHTTIVEEYIVKDSPQNVIVYTDINQNYVKVSYNTYKSNLIFNVINNSYIAYAASNSFNPLKISFNSENLNNILHITYTNKVIQNYFNNYKINRIYHYNPRLLNFNEENFYNLNFNHIAFNVNLTDSLLKKDNYINNIKQYRLYNWEEIPLTIDNQFNNNLLIDIYNEINLNLNIKTDNNFRAYEEL